MITRPKTIICDIDGIIFKHSGDICKQYLIDPDILEGAYDKFKEWDMEGYTIILMTGRRESGRDKLEKTLERLGFFYDHLIMGVGGGIRGLINDKKPDGAVTTRTFCPERNKGLKYIDESLEDEGKKGYIKKPWGSEVIIETNEFYTVKKLFMKTGCKCSLQYHEKKHETIYVLSGIMRLWVGKDENSIEYKILNAGAAYVIEPRLIHRMESLDDCVYLESSTSELDDVIRVQDEYGRA